MILHVYVEESAYDYTTILILVLLLRKESLFLIGISYYVHLNYGGTHGVMVTIIGNEHNNLSSKPGQSCLHFI